MPATNPQNQCPPPVGTLPKFFRIKSQKPPEVAGEERRREEEKNPFFFSLMPGSIQVSVLGLVDLPSPPPLSSLSLKVVMGQREYHTVGDGELSFPVMSLRENLIVVMHDAEGEEILRTEFRTMLLMERGFCETLFPLKNGGSLNMKLQFLLSAEDHKRIREMRDSALKKKRRMEKPWTRHKRSLADNRIGGSISINAQIITEEVAIPDSELTDPVKHSP